MSHYDLSLENGVFDLKISCGPQTIPKKRADIFQLITEGRKYHDIIGLFPDASKTGFVFETISIICIIFKQLMPDYEFISDSNMEDTSLIFKPVESVRELFNQILAL